MAFGFLGDLLIIGALILMNAFFAGAEIALVSASRPRLRQLAEDGNQSARAVLRLVENPTHFLSTVQVGITIAGFFASAVGAVSLVAVLTGTFENAFGPMAGFANTAALIVVTSLIAFASIVLGELVPKSLAIRAADRIALLVARPVTLLAKVARPVVLALTGTTNVFLRLFGASQQARLPSITREELLTLLESGKDEGVIGAREAAMTEGVFDLRDRVARELMAPRVDVVGVPATATVEEARDIFLSHGHSRMPVYDGDLDHISGILYVKDLLRYCGMATDQPVARLARPPLYVPEGQPAARLLRQMQQERRHLAVIVDEHGGTAGIITLEDLLEEIVGEIADEYDPHAEDPLKVVAEDEIIISGRLPIADLNDALELELSEPGVDTVSGLITTRLGRFAQVGDMVEMEEAVAEVLAVDRTRVRQARVRRTAPRPDWREEEEEG